MKKSRKRLHLRNIRIRERMLLIYIIGGIVPFIGTSMYISVHTGNAIIDASKTAQRETVSFLASEIDQAMPMAERVAEEICSNEDLYRIIETEYKETDLSVQDRQQLEKIQMTRLNYAESISDIIIYVNNSTLYSEEPFAPLTSDVKATQWYQRTRQSGHKMYWSYYEEGGQKYIQLFRMLENEIGNEIGIMAVRLNSSILEKQIQENSMNVMLLQDDNKVVLSNFLLKQNDYFLLKEIADSPEETKTFSVSRNVDEYLLTYQKIQPQMQDGSYTVVCIQDYQRIKGSFNRISLNTYVIVAISLVVSVLMIVWFSVTFGARLKTLRRQMHLVANGRYGEVEPISGNDEIAEIYQEVEKMMGDIRDLTSNIVEEKVQKEKLHTRQKEVEFKMLASQINPHFLYNTLETIRMKARVNEQKEIEDLVKMLAKIMRRNIQVSNQMVSLQSEVELTENYLKIQEYRFGDRIVSNMIVDPEVDLNMEVMPLIIQPFVENAFVHGLEAVSGQGKLVVEITQDEEDVIIYIRDNGVGMPYYKLGDLRHILNTGENEDQAHIGINNVNQRLKIQYGNKYGVRIDSSENKGTTIELRIPRNP